MLNVDSCASVESELGNNVGHISSLLNPRERRKERRNNETPFVHFAPEHLIINHRTHHKITHFSPCHNSASLSAELRKSNIHEIQ